MPDVVTALIVFALLVVFMLAIVSAADELLERSDRKRIEAELKLAIAKSDPAYFLPGHRNSRLRR